jgi:hypothetical protein
MTIMPIPRIPFSEQAISRNEHPSSSRRALGRNVRHPEGILHRRQVVEVDLLARPPASPAQTAVLLGEAIAKNSWGTEPHRPSSTNGAHISAAHAILQCQLEGPAVDPDWVKHSRKLCHVKGARHVLAVVSPMVGDPLATNAAHSPAIPEEHPDG